MMLHLTDLTREKFPSLQAGVFQPAAIRASSLIDLSLAYAGYIVLGNLSLKMNPVGFYQILKALIAPTILFINTVKSGTRPAGNVVLSITLLTGGVVSATVTDDQVMSNVYGILIGLAYVLSTALYNIWAGSKQKALQAGTSRLKLPGPLLTVNVSVGLFSSRHRSHRCICRCAYPFAHLEACSLRMGMSRR
jgi:hypothetical protein